MTMQEKFLSLYREYETILRDKGRDIKEIENTVDTLEGGRLRMCRQIRNYLSHSDDALFVNISDKMITFLQNNIDRLKEEDDIVKKHIKKIDICMLKEDTKCSEAIEIFKKLKRQEIVMICSDGTFRLISIYELLGCKSTQKIGTLKSTKLKPKYCCPLDKYDSVDKDIITLCTDNGLPTGKLLGQVWV